MEIDKCYRLKFHDTSMLHAEQNVLMYRRAWGSSKSENWYKLCDHLPDTVLYLVDLVTSLCLQLCDHTFLLLYYNSARHF